MDDAIVVTGIGLVTPLGCTREKTWGFARSGHSVIQVQNAEEFNEEDAAKVRTAPFLSPDGVHRIFPIAVSAAHEALNDARIGMGQAPPERTGCSVSASKPIFEADDDMPLAPNEVIEYLSGKLKISGPMINVVAACATGIHSILTAARWLREGLCDMALAGSAESSLHPLIISGFDRLGVLSDSPRPFDKNRNGFVMGEGAGVFVLERKSRADSRGARIYAEVAGGAAGADTTHPTRFAQDGSSIASVIRRSLKNAGISGEEIDYVNLHGTGTRLNDLVETRAIKSAFGNRADTLSLSSTKASTGHLLGAAGSVEAGLACMALRDQYVPPTANFETSDPECDLDYTPRTGKSKPLRTAMSLSFGFGGPIGAIIFKKL